MKRTDALFCSFLKFIFKFYFKREPIPYSDCTEDIKSFNSIFTNAMVEKGLIYTRKYCFDLCFNRYLSEKCHCHDITYSMLNFSTNACTTRDEFLCFIEKFKTFYLSEVLKNCSSECPGIFKLKLYSV